MHADERKSPRAAREHTVGIATEGEYVMAARVSVAASFARRFMGLLGRARVDADEGMLFRPGGSIHTVGMRTPIDVAFLDRDYRVLKVKDNVRPWRMTIAPRRTCYTLELAPGRLAHAKVAVGQQLKVIEKLHV